MEAGIQVRAAVNDGPRRTGGKIGGSHPLHSRTLRRRINVVEGERRVPVGRELARPPLRRRRRSGLRGRIGIGVASIAITPLAEQGVR